MGRALRACALLAACVPAFASSAPTAPGTYVPLSDVTRFLADLGAAADGRVSPPQGVGDTVEGRTLELVQVGAFADKALPALLLTAMHHGREPLGMLANLAFLRKLIADEATGCSEAAALLRFRRFLLIPSVNPDAYAWNVAHPAQRMARKNRRSTCTASGRKYDDDGVDLNRNYPFEWDVDNVGSSPNGCYDDFRGPSPFSEPESRSMRDLLAGPLGANISVALNWHSFGKVVNLPFAVQSRPEPPAALYGPLLTLARSMAGAMGFTYGHPWAAGLYTCNGEASDYMVDTHGILAYSPELGPVYVDSMNNAQFEAGMWPGEADVPPLVGEAIKGVTVAAWAAGANVQLEVGAVAPPPHDTAGGGECDPAARLAQGSRCARTTVALTVANAGARPPTGTLRVTVVPAGGMAHGPVCVGGGGGVAPACVNSLSHALLDAQKATAAPFCREDVVEGSLQPAAGGRRLQDEEGEAGTLAGAAHPMVSDAVLRRLRAALAVLKEGREGSGIDLHPRRDMPWHADISTVFEAALAEEEEAAAVVVGAEQQQQQRRLQPLPPASTSVLGSATFVPTLPAWGRVSLDASTGQGGSAIGLHVPLSGEGLHTAQDGCVLDAAAAAAYVSLSDDHTCSVYSITCSSGVKPTLLYRGPAGCMPCAAFRHLPEAGVGAPPPAVVVPTSSATPAAAASSGAGVPSNPAPAPPGPSPADANDGAWRDASNEKPQAELHGGGGSAAWPWSLSSSGGVEQLSFLGVGLLAGACAGIAVYRRVTLGRGAYVRVRTGVEGEGEEEDGQGAPRPARRTLRAGRTVVRPAAPTAREGSAPGGGGGGQASAPHRPATRSGVETTETTLP